MDKPSSHKLFLALICVLAASPVLRIGDVQILEFALFINSGWLLLVLVFRKFSVPLDKLWLSLGNAYAIFFAITLLLALASLRFRFYPPPLQESFLKLPLVLSIARIVELALGVFYMLYIATILKNNSGDRLFALRTYYWVGFASTVFSVLSIPLNLAAGLNWGVYPPNLRARGFFNEGGPYGLYLISIIVTGLVLLRIGGLKRIQVLATMAILIPIFLMSQSKAAIIGCVVLFLINVFIIGSKRLKISLVLAACTFSIAIVAFTNFNRSFMGYIESYDLVQDIGPFLDEASYGGFGGRVAGAVLIPRMIAAHPLTGIGIGNYPLVFNDPAYLQGLPYTGTWELPGIGIAGYMAELGIPLFVCLIALLFCPMFIAYRKKSLPIVLVFAAVQPLVHIFGAQLNFYYPWICSGMALSLMDYRGSSKGSFNT